MREKAVGDEVLKSLTPDQHVVRIVRDELIALLGGEAEPIRWASSPPTVFMLCGLQGSGKTTTCAVAGALGALAGAQTDDGSVRPPAPCRHQAAGGAGRAGRRLCPHARKRLGRATR